LHYSSTSLHVLHGFVRHAEGRFVSSIAVGIQHSWELLGTRESVWEFVSAHSGVGEGVSKLESLRPGHLQHFGLYKVLGPLNAHILGDIGFLLWVWVGWGECLSSFGENDM